MDSLAERYPALPGDWLEVGSKLRETYGEGNPNNCLYHVRGIVDDRAVLRFWVKHKNRWAYECKSLLVLQMMKASGHLQRVS